MQIPRYTLHDHFKLGRGFIALSRSEVFPNRSNGYGEIILLDRGQAQPLHGIPALSDRTGSLLDRTFQFLLCLDRALW